MKTSLFLSIIYLFFLTSTYAQTTPGPAESKITDELCKCISKLDFNKITNKESADEAFRNCFSEQASLLFLLAAERNVQMTDQPGMRKIGEEIGANLVKQNCQSFVKLTMLMADKTSNGSSLIGTTEGKLKRIETKDFNYFVITDTDNKEKSFIWLRQFTGSENINKDISKLVGNKLKIDWQEMEVYIPSAKNYYKIKEVIGLEVLK